MISSKFFIYQPMHKRVALKNIKIYTKTALTRFGLITVIREPIISACYSLTLASSNNTLPDDGN
jgi:hypothetical protein